MAIVPSGFDSETLWEFLFLELKLWAWELLCVASAPRSFRVAFEATISLLLLQYLLHAGVGPTPLSFSAPPSGLVVYFTVWLQF